VDDRADDDPVRDTASILHLDLDAYFAAVEQRDKPSLRGKPVVVGGTGPRGVVATASYEARAFGIRSAMPTHEARARCPHAAFLNGRFDVYRETSAVIMGVLRQRSPLVEPVSLDEAYVDLAAAPRPLPTDGHGLHAFVDRLKSEIAAATGGLRASVGVGSSKLVAKIASDLEKPDGLVIVRPGSEDALLRPMPVTAIPGVGPATSEKLRRVGVRTVADLQRLGLDELVALVGRAHGGTLAQLAHGRDDRTVEPDRETKSISVEDTFDVDLVDPVVLAGVVTRHARLVCDRLRAARLFGRTVTVKVRMHDFTTHTRSTTLPSPTDRARLVVDLALALLAEVDTSTGVRLLGVGVSGLTDWVQDDLFRELEDAEPEVPAPPATDRTDMRASRRGRVGWSPGADVEHRSYGPGWVWGAGLGRVTVRFETAETGPGAVRTFAVDDPDLSLRGSAAGPPGVPVTDGCAPPARPPRPPGSRPSPDGR
jgi:DNA polymerase-4